MINLLIKMADSLDQRGLHGEASKVDALIKKIAMDLEYDYSKNNMLKENLSDFSIDSIEDILKEQKPKKRRSRRRKG